MATIFFLAIAGGLTVGSGVSILMGMEPAFSHILTGLALIATAISMYNEKNKEE